MRFPRIRLSHLDSNWYHRVVALPHSYLGELDHYKMVVLSDSFFPTLP